MTVEQNSPLWPDAASETATLVSSIREFAAVRFQLAQLEFTAARQSIRRSVIACSVTMAVALLGLAMLAVSAGLALDGALGLSSVGWLSLFAGVFLVTALIMGLVLNRRLRTELVFFEESFEELREDLAWLRERLP